MTKGKLRHIFLISFSASLASSPTHLSAGLSVEETSIAGAYKMNRGLAKVLRSDAKLELMRSDFISVEGVLRLADGTILFCEQGANKIHRIALDGRISTYLEETNRTTGLAIDSEGRLVGAQSGVPRIAELLPQRRTIVDAFEGEPLSRPNDLVIDKRGGIYFTDPAVGPESAAAPRRRSMIFYRSSRGELKIITDSIQKPNGIQLSPDEKTLYATDGERIMAYNVQADGSVANPRIFAAVSGDGMTVDSAGRLYVAINANTDTGIMVLSPAGAILGRIPAPGRIQSIGFGGKNLNTLYAVGHKTVYRIPMLSRGLKKRLK